MTIEGLGKKFQEARFMRQLTLEEAARLTKIRPSRLAEIEADDFSQFPSLAYAKGFLLIYGKFLDVDVTPYLEAFEGSSNVTVDGYSYLQETPAPKPTLAPVIRTPTKSSRQASAWPLLIAVGVVVFGFLTMKLVLNLKRLGPNEPTMVGVPQPSAAPASSANVPLPSAQPSVTQIAREDVNTKSTAAATMSPPAPAKIPPADVEVRRAQPVRPGENPKEIGTEKPAIAEGSGAENRIDIKPLRKTYIKVVVDNASNTPVFEKWVSPTDGPIQFHGQHVAVRVIDRAAVQISKNGKAVTDAD